MSSKKTEIAKIYEQILQEELKPGLYVIATDIGNPADITLRALALLEKIDFVICEERKVGASLLKRYGISKQIELLNEHNEKEQTPLLLEKLLSGRVRAALISDAGTPLFADPGSKLVSSCHRHKIPVIPVPGASSLMTTLMAAGKVRESFLYYGFLPAAKSERVTVLKDLKKKDDLDLIFLEAPYRLKPFIRDLKMVLGSKRQGVIAYRLTYPQEKIFTGDLQELEKMAEELPKGEFVFILLARNVRSGKK